MEIIYETIPKTVFPRHTSSVPPPPSGPGRHSAPFVIPGEAGIHVKGTSLIGGVFRYRQLQLPPLPNPPPRGGRGGKEPDWAELPASCERQRIRGETS